MLRRMFLLAVVVCAATVPALFADAPMTKLRIEVRTNGGKPVDRASVVVDFQQGRSAVKLGKKVIKHWEIRTNQEGVAAIPSIPQGRIESLLKWMSPSSPLTFVARGRNACARISPSPSSCAPIRMSGWPSGK